MSDKKLAIVLVSGGMDSAVVASIAKEDGYDLAFLHLNYGQRTQAKELDSYQKLARYFHVDSKRQKVIDMTFLNQIGGSSLTDENINVSKYEGDSDEIPSSYVPFRNTHIIAMAVSWAEVIGAEKIYVGANYEDSPGYPDCRPEYYQTYNQLIKVGTKEGNIQLITPIIMLKKKEIVLKGMELKTPLELTWSCYAREDIACGQCDSCALRLRGFKEANIDDPISYIHKED